MHTNGTEKQFECTLCGQIFGVPAIEIMLRLAEIFPLAHANMDIQNVGSIIMYLQILMQ